MSFQLILALKLTLLLPFLVTMVLIHFMCVYFWSVDSILFIFLLNRIIVYYKIEFVFVFMPNLNCIVSRSIYVYFLWLCLHICMCLFFLNFTMRFVQEWRMKIWCVVLIVKILLADYLLLCLWYVQSDLFVTWKNKRCLWTFRLLLIILLCKM